MAVNEGYVEIKKESNGIGTIEFYHPQSNSLPSHLLTKLALTISEAGKDDEINIIILKSAGDRTFCAGASFDELKSISNIRFKPCLVAKERAVNTASLVSLCERCVPVIASASEDDI